MQNQYLIGLGSSHPRAEHYLERAITCLHDVVSIVSQSDIEQSGGVGTDDPLVFQNQVVLARSPLSATALWFQLSLIETKLGRIRTKVNSARTIDLDILYGLGFENKDSFITMPHPRFFERKFARDLAIQALHRAGEHARHCERSEAIHAFQESRKLGCFTTFAMTKKAHNDV